MIRGLYTNGMAMMLLREQMQATANNLANANTAGYKKDTVISKTFPEMLLYQLDDKKSEDKPVKVGKMATGVQLAEIVTDHTNGIQRKTSDSMSLAITGEGYFTVLTPQGERYTKNGEFHRSMEGKLITSDGYLVLGEKGEITIEDDSFVISEDGRVFTGNKTSEKLKIVGFSSPLDKEGATLFKGENPVAIDSVRVRQSYVEDSNVNSLEEMNHMINIMRSYEANQKVMQTQDTALEKAVTEIARLY